MWDKNKSWSMHTLRQAALNLCFNRSWHEV